MNSLSAEEASYLAGLIDGEGTVTLTRRNKNRQPELVVSISNTERQLLEFALSAIGAGKITNKRRYQEHHLPSFVYSVSNRQALDLLKQLTPLLKSYKAKRARLILANYTQLTPRNGKYSPELLDQRQRFVENVLAIKPKPEKYFFVDDCSPLYRVA